MKTKIIIPIIVAAIAIAGIFYAVSIIDEPQRPSDCRFKYGKGSPEMFECLEKFQNNAPLPIMIQIKQGETVTYQDLTFLFYDIEDSRYPSDVTCIWEGRVKVMISISNETDKISAPFTPNYSLAYFQPYNITLTDILPHPISTEKPNYTATLQIQRLE